MFKDYKTMFDEMLNELQDVEANNMYVVHITLDNGTYNYSKTVILDYMEFEAKDRAEKVTVTRYGETKAANYITVRDEPLNEQLERKREEIEVALTFM